MFVMPSTQLIADRKKTCR